MTKFQSPPALLGLAQDMIVKGWQPVWCPQRQSGSFSPEAGCTGGVEFPAVLPQPATAHKLAFRPPPEVLVLDVDDYDDKQGEATIERAEAWLGPLPRTYRVTARGYRNASGRYLFRIPADLVVTDSSLYQFADPETGRTDVEIVRTGHRFSWAPGDYHYKNDELIQCWDDEGTLCELPDVSELPELPEKWVAYFRNPPVPQKREAYTRPSDGADWWLSQADSSLGTDAELSSFAYNMLLSRVPEEEIWEQWNRVSVALNPADPWERDDFDRHIGARAQSKADQILQHQDDETDWFGGTGADLGAIAQKAKDAYDNRQSLMAAVTQPVVDFSQAILDQGFNRIGYACDPEDPDFYDEVPAAERSLEDQLRALDSYQRLLFDQLARTQALKDAAKILAGQFKQFDDISQLPDPPAPSLLSVVGKDQVSGCVVGPRTVTVFSGHRASGKTWVSAAWAAQVIRSGGHVFWVDFERQPYGLVQKLRSLKIPVHLIARHVHYTSKLPGADRLIREVKSHAVSGVPVLLVLDAFRGLQNTMSPGSSANDGDAVEQVYLEYLNPMSDAGATIVLLDHMSKTGDAGTFGSERKESAADYVIKVEQQVPFTKTQPGFSSLTVTKDRYGVIAAGTAAGYLWMPGDGEKSGPSVEQYPDIPELRNWSPLEAETERNLELSLKGNREALLTELVAEAPLTLSINKLTTDAMAGYAELFTSESSTKRYIRDMIKEGKLVKDQGNGRLDVPAEPEAQGAVDLAQLTDDGE